MGSDDHIDAYLSTEQLAGRSVTAMIDQLEAAKRELDVAEAARKARADEVARIAGTVDTSIAQAIVEATTERDGLEKRLHDVNQRLGELESVRSKARIERFATPIGSAAIEPASESETDPPEVVGSFDRTEDIGETDQPLGSTDDDDDGYEDSWYEVLKQQAEAEEADGREP